MFGIFEKQNYFFGSHLIEFGIKHQLPDAVRLGEEVAMKYGEEIDKDLYYSMNMFKLDNPASDSFRETKLRSSSLNKENKYYSFERE